MATKTKFSTSIRQRQQCYISGEDRRRRKWRKLIKKVVEESKKSIYGISTKALVFRYDALSYSQNFDDGNYRDEYYLPVPKKPTASSSGNMKKGVVPTIEVSNSNPFEVLNSAYNDVELGTNERTTNLVNNEVTSSRSSFMNIHNSSTMTTPIIDKIRKFEELLTSGKATLVDEAGDLLKNVEYPDDYDSEDKVALVDNDMARSMALERVGFGTQSLMEQWRDSYGNSDYDEDSYDDDMYEDSLLPIPFWAETVNTACYVQNRVLVTKPHNKTPYELLHGRLPSIGFMRPFGSLVTILNTLDPLGKFQGKETLHVNFMENKPNVAGSGPAWLFDIDREEGTQTYVLFPVLFDGSQNNNKDALVDGKEHDDDI
nr:ribonuclease H-like domain-containing protein [Tanacetum cinerariifolium]